MDSLKQLLSSVKADTTRARLWNEISWHYHRLNADSSYYYAQKALDLGRRIDDPRAVARALNLQAIIDAESNDNANSKSKNLEAYEIALRIPDTFLIAATSNDLGIIAIEEGRDEEAIRLLQQSLNYSKDVLGKVYTLLNIGIVYDKRGDKNLAQSYFNKAIEIAQPSKNPFVLSTVKIHIADSYKKQQQLDSAILVIKEARAYAQSSGDKAIVIESTRLLGNYYLEEKQFEIAEQTLREAQKLALDFNDQLLQVNVILDIMNLKNRLGHYKATIALYSEYKHLLNNTRDYYLKEYLYSLLSYAYAAKQEAALSAVYLDSAVMVRDSLNNLTITRILNNLELNYELEKQKTQNKALEEQQRAAASEINRQNQFITALILILLLSVAIIIQAVIAFRKNKNASHLLQSMVDEKTRELIIANRELKISNQELERFAHIASHDLKEPLRNISSFSGLIQKKIKAIDPPEIATYLSFVYQNATQLNTLIEDVLEFSNVRNDRSVLEQNVDCQQLMERVEETLAVLIQQKQAKLIYESLPSIVSNEQQLFLVFKNIVENGLKFNQSSEPQVQITYSDSDQMHIFSIRDNGIGIEEPFKEKIFDMFYRLHNKSEYEGSGLGLSIAEKIIRRLIGAIEVESEFGKGTTFHIHLLKQQLT
ncbi:MAG TPA: ATP-binding protein [Saprospiraceae bacterium]|nr:ATP-binding protein [Saprospiraceae bacterium]HMQ85337.1 ATP-binding protein [Saprospiraceae bacterium]